MASHGSADTGDVAPELKHRAMDAAPVGITIADATDPEAPLVYVNDAFVDITGYSRSFSLGRNCRFLQGSETDPEAVAELARAVAAREPTTVELKNYRRDGDPFWNRVEIAPLPNDDGEVTHFVGFQSDITARREAERAVREEREALSRLVHRINGLLEGVTSQLVRATSAPALRRGVTEEIVRAEPYVAAWVGEAAVGEDAVSPDPESFVLAGVDREPEPGEGLPTTVGAAALVEALRTGELRTAATTTLPGEASLSGGHTVSALAAVPLAAREGTEGVLAVYSDKPDAFDEPERAVLSSLGRAVATALDAHETRRILTTDPQTVLELAIEGGDWWLPALARETGTTVEYLGAMQREDGRDVLTFALPGATVEDARAGASHLDGIESLSPVAERESGVIVDVVPDRESIVAVVAGLGAKTEALVAREGEALLTCTLAATADIRGFVDSLSERYGRVELRAKRERTDVEATPERFVDAVRERLTDRQATALHRAYVAGYFERPRETDGDDLAASMDITRSTFHQHLAAAQRKLLRAFFETEF
jgi:PAS domain S-box-containing protein